MSTIYRDVAMVLESFHQKKGSVKSLVFHKDVKQKESVFALVCKTLKFKSVLEQLVASAKIFDEQRQLEKQKWLVYVMVYDMILADGIKGSGHFKKLLLKYKNPLVQALVRMKVRAKAVDNEGLLPEEVRNPLVLPRYVRVNTLKAEVADILPQLPQLLSTNSGGGDDSNEQRSAAHQPTKRRRAKREENENENEEQNSEKNESEAKAAEKNKKKSESEAAEEIKVDEHLADLLVLPPTVKMNGRHPLVQDGTLVLQDKASCFSAHALSPPEHAHVIDCCAAPGNKTSHLAALMKNTGKIFAFDMDLYRLNTLKRLTARAGATNITAVCSDFLKVNPHDPQYANVEYFMADPSCSGSGIVTRYDVAFTTAPDEDEWVDLGDDDEKKKRLAGLAAFQTSIITHCLKFPRVKKVVYSTCSVHEEENERVVRAILDAHPHVRLARALPQWPRRGRPLFPGADNCLRTLPVEDKTIGFFVACFEIASSSAGTTGKRKRLDEDDDNDDKVASSTSSSSTSLTTSSASTATTTASGGSEEKKKKKKRRKRKNKNKTVGVAVPASSSSS